MLCIPEHLALQLRLEDEDEREVTLADGSTRLVRQVGPLRVRFKNRISTMSALILGDEVLLGAIPMQAMDIVAIPIRETIDVNPNSPNFGHHRAKGLQRPI
jgi:hypothetical protein